MKTGVLAKISLDTLQPNSV